MALKGRCQGACESRSCPGTAGSGLGRPRSAPLLLSSDTCVPPALSGCAFLPSQYFPSKGHQGKNVCLRRKGFEFPGARYRTIWVCQLMEKLLE